MKKTLIILSVTLLGLLRVSTAEASWGDYYCDIVNGSASARTTAFNTALVLYQDLDETNRKCKAGVRFKAPQTVKLPSGFTIDRVPPSGQENGFSIRKCRGPTQSYPEEGCPTMSNTDVVLDVSGTGGDCPIKVYKDSKISIFQLKIIATNPARAVCTANGNPIPLEDEDSDYVYMHEVTICSPQGCGTTPDNDTDDDGVLDSDDDCPNTPSGTPVDANGCPIAVDNDTDDDGVVNGDDNCPNTPSGTPVDANGCPIAVDNDTDDDGVVNGDDNCPNTPSGTPVDANGCPIVVDTDTDDDGVVNGDDNCPNTPSGTPVDANGCPIVVDTDTDDDGVVNGDDNCPNTPSGTPVDANGCPVTDPDSDHDGVPNSDDDCPNTPAGTDVNDKGCPDFGTPGGPIDVDPDNDGLTTTLEAELRTNPNDPDTDGDGAKDGVDCFPNEPAKYLCGGTTTIMDLDFDDDGVLDASDNCAAVSNPDQADGDGNGIGDVCDPSGSVSFVGGGGGGGTDTDGDGLSDSFEERVSYTDPTKSDTDGDGLSDGEEVDGMTYLGGRGPNDPDVDGDGVCDGPATVGDADGQEICNAGPSGTGDNCPLVENPAQDDTDGDGVGDACQGDLDGDGRLDTEDNCVFVPNGDQGDFDKDGLGDACDLSLGLADNFGPEGCGCRIDAKAPRGAGGLIPFLAMMLPIVLFRLARRMLLLV